MLLGKNYTIYVRTYSRISILKNNCVKIIKEMKKTFSFFIPFVLIFLISCEINGITTTKKKNTSLSINIPSEFQGVWTQSGSFEKLIVKENDFYLDSADITVVQAINVNEIEVAQEDKQKGDRIETGFQEVYNKYTGKYSLFTYVVNMTTDESIINDYTFTRKYDNSLIYEYTRTKNNKQVTDIRYVFTKN